MSRLKMKLHQFSVKVMLVFLLITWYIKHKNNNRSNCSKNIYLEISVDSCRNFKYEKKMNSIVNTSVNSMYTTNLGN